MAKELFFDSKLFKILLIVLGAVCIIQIFQAGYHLGQWLYALLHDATLSTTQEIFNEKNQLTNPVALIEIWSPSTEKIDKTDKLEEYRSIDSLQEYIMFSQDEAKAELYIKKTKEKWENNLIEGLEKTVEMPSLNVKLPMKKIYEGVGLRKK